MKKFSPVGFYIEKRQLGSKTRSLGQILEKPCVRSKGHIFNPIVMKLDQNVCLDEISDELKNGICRIKN